jgi:hypothetical protein
MRELVDRNQLRWISGLLLQGKSTKTITFQTGTKQLPHLQQVSGLRKQLYMSNVTVGTLGNLIFCHLRHYFVEPDACLNTSLRILGTQTRLNWQCRGCFGLTLAHLFIPCYYIPLLYTISFLPSFSASSLFFHWHQPSTHSPMSTILS